MVNDWHNNVMHRYREAGRILMDNHSSRPGEHERYPLFDSNECLTFNNFLDGFFLGSASIGFAGALPSLFGFNAVPVGPQ